MHSTLYEEIKSITLGIWEYNAILSDKERGKIRFNTNELWQKGKIS